MSSDLRLLITDQYKQEAHRWLHALKRKESVAISFIPKTDRVIRLQQAVNDKKLLSDVFGKDANKYNFVNISFGSPVPEDVHELEIKIANLLDKTHGGEEKRSFETWMSHYEKRGQTLVLVIPEAEKLLTPAEKHTLTLLSYLIDQQYPRVLVVSCFEMDVSHSSVMAMLSPSTRLYANMFEYPLYSQENTHQFIQLLETEWGVSIPKKDKDEIFSLCGGHFWLIKEAVRRVADMGKWNPTDEGMLFRLRTILQQLLPSEQSVIKKLIAGKSDFSNDERLSLAYLQRMHVVENGKCVIGMLTDFIIQYEQKVAGFSIVNNVVLLNNVPVDKFFSRKEYRIVRLLVENEGEIISRNDIATVLWPINTEKEYSDWAIDQAMARVRKRLQQLYISPNVIQVIRGKGYLLSLTN